MKAFNLGSRKEPAPEKAAKPPRPAPPGKSGEPGAEKKKGFLSMNLSGGKKKPAAPPPPQPAIAAGAREKPVRRKPARTAAPAGDQKKRTMLLLALLLVIAAGGAAFYFVFNRPEEPASTTALNEEIKSNIKKRFAKQPLTTPKPGVSQTITKPHLQAKAATAAPAAPTPVAVAPEEATPAPVEATPAAPAPEKPATATPEPALAPKPPVKNVVQHPTPIETATPAPVKTRRAATRTSRRKIISSDDTSAPAYPTKRRASKRGKYRVWRDPTATAGNRTPVTAGAYEYPDYPQTAGNPSRLVAAPFGKSRGVKQPLPGAGSMFPHSPYSESSGLFEWRPVGRAAADFSHIPIIASPRPQGRSKTRIGAEFSTASTLYSVHVKDSTNREELIRIGRLLQVKATPEIHQNMAGSRAVYSLTVGHYAQEYKAFNIAQTVRSQGYDAVVIAEKVYH